MKILIISKVSVKLFQKPQVLFRLLQFRLKKQEVGHGATALWRC
jgi:hypothetical protein